MDNASAVAKQLKHDELCARIEKFLKDNNLVEVYGLKILDPIKQGKYNTALRRICTESVNTKIANRMIRTIMEFQVPLEIKPTEQNAEGYSAIDYATKHNPSAVALMQQSSFQNVMNVASEFAPAVREQLKEFLPGLAPEYPCAQGQPSGMRPDQRSAANDMMLRVTEMLRQEVARATSGVPETAEQRMERINRSVQSTFGAQTSPNVSQADASEKIMMGLTQTISKLSDAHPAHEFLTLYQQEKYEAAMRKAALIQDQSVASIFAVFQPYKPSLPFDMNQMRDTRGRTPLHDAAEAKNMMAYYTMCNFCNSEIADKQGITAADIRRRHQMSTLDPSNPLASFLSSVLPTGEKKSEDPNTSSVAFNARK